MNKYDLKLEAEVNGRDKKIGRLDKLVVNRKTWQVSHLIVVDGLLFKHALVMPLSLVERTTPTAVYLAVNGDQLGDYPPFNETIVEKGTLPQTMPPLQTGINEIQPQAPSFLTGTPGRMPAKERLRTGIPSDVLVMDSRTAVVGLGGHIGPLKRLITEAESGFILQLIVEWGKLLPQQVVIPAEKISSLDEKNIQVVVSPGDAADLPAYFVPSSG